MFSEIYRSKGMYGYNKYIDRPMCYLYEKCFLTLDVLLIV